MHDKIYLLYRNRARRRFLYDLPNIPARLIDKRFRRLLTSKTATRKAADNVQFRSP
jgi:hypothetical protein